MKVLLIIVLPFFALLLEASEPKITKEISYMDIGEPGKITRVKRVDTPDSYLANRFALTSRPTPPFFIQPFLAAEGVETYGELEVLNFLNKKEGLLIDVRPKRWYSESTIPGSVHIVFKELMPKSAKRKERLLQLGAKFSNGAWDFKKAKSIIIYCNGVWCGLSPAVIRSLMEIGYPKEKLKYYRGGMQSWQILGLTTYKPKGTK